MKKNKVWSGLALVVAVAGMSASMTVQAAAGVDIAQESVNLNIGATSVVTVDYSGLPGGFADLAVISADTAIAVPALVDVGGNKANLAIASTGTGTTSVAVYSAANPAIVDYVAVQSGMPTGNQIVTTVNGMTLTTMFPNRVVTYNALLTGKNGATLAVSGLVIEPETGVDCLKVTGSLQTGDSKTPGMNTFYANFYDAAGGLMKRQAVYSRDPVSTSQLEISWYIPEGCTSIIIE